MTRILENLKDLKNKLPLCCFFQNKVTGLCIVIFFLTIKKTACVKLVNVIDLNVIIINSVFLKLTMFSSSHKF